jgi:hypothetical protein
VKRLPGWIIMLLRSLPIVFLETMNILKLALATRPSSVTKCAEMNPGKVSKNAYPYS